MFYRFQNKQPTQSQQHSEQNVSIISMSSLTAEQKCCHLQIATSLSTFRRKKVQRRHLVRPCHYTRRFPLLRNALAPGPMSFVSLRPTTQQATSWWKRSSGILRSSRFSLLCRANFLKEKRCWTARWQARWQAASHHLLGWKAFTCPSFFVFPTRDFYTFFFLIRTGWRNLFLVLDLCEKCMPFTPLR